jgi:Flp pilus assembly protein TadD
MRYSAVICLLLLAGSAFAQSNAALQSARESVAKYQQEEKARQAAIADGLFNEADSRAQAGRVALIEALRAYEAGGVPGAAPKEVLFEYTDAARRLGYFDQAGEAMEAAVRLDAGDARAWALLGMSLIECGPKHERQGLEALRKSLAIDSASKDAASALNALGKLYYRQSLYALAAEAFDKALTIDPANIEAVLRRSALQVREGKVLEASNAIDALGAAAEPLDAMTRVLLRECIMAFEDDGRFVDDTAENHAAFAKLLYRAARIPEAILASSRAIQLNPKDTKTMNFVGSMYTQMGNADGARQAFQKSLDTDPNQPNIAEALKQLPPPAAPAAAPAPPAAQ